MSEVDRDDLFRKGEELFFDKDLNNYYYFLTTVAETDPNFFEVPEEQTKTVLNVLHGTDFDGRKVNVEVTDQPEGQRTTKRESHHEEHHSSYGERKPKKGSGVIRGAAAKSARTAKPKGKPSREERSKPSREERGYTSARGPKGAAEWAKFFEGQVESQPFYETFRKKKKK